MEVDQELIAAVREELFPIRVRDKSDRHGLFSTFVRQNRNTLNEVYGTLGFVGEETARRAQERGAIYCGFGHIKEFSWCTVEADIESDTTVTFRTIDRDGRVREVFANIVFPLNELEVFIEHQKRRIVSDIRRQIEEAREAARVAAEEKELYSKLFG
ncbi:hypothetical protein H1O16_gp151 [Burkholderia phage BcepSaruman]|uniref:Uncharacterized protein n=1 Tax=Burkholderia phage BcepSaruman TaxID=2530032 RepID=A0A4D5ZC80_9CAUD|nr:hypothetical protein H1O16_gp151 [Burkholderia phage BcepSaruman]QBX06564.1 hypothetical protein BcepSaruman_151 [Burkholderia phage BcepSaruman]